MAKLCGICNTQIGSGKSTMLMRKSTGENVLICDPCAQMLSSIAGKTNKAQSLSARSHMLQMASGIPDDEIRAFLTRYLAQFKDGGNDTSARMRVPRMEGPGAFTGSAYNPSVPPPGMRHGLPNMEMSRTDSRNAPALRKGQRAAIRALSATAALCALAAGLYGGYRLYGTGEPIFAALCAVFGLCAGVLIQLWTSVLLRRCCRGR